MTITLHKTYDNIISVECKEFTLKNITICSLTREFLPKNIPKSLLVEGVFIRHSTERKRKPPKIFIEVHTPPKIEGNSPYKCTIVSEVERGIDMSRKFFVSNIKTTLTCIGGK